MLQMMPRADKYGYFKSCICMDLIANSTPIVGGITHSKLEWNVEIGWEKKFLVKKPIPKELALIGFTSLMYHVIGNFLILWETMRNIL